jgi:hypothetical protein
VSGRGAGRRARRWLTLVKAGGSFVQRLGCHVEAVWPGDGAYLLVGARLGEERGIGEGFGHASPVPVGEIDVADEAVP